MSMIFRDSNPGPSGEFKSEALLLAGFLVWDR